MKEVIAIKSVKLIYVVIAFFLLFLYPLFAILNYYEYVIQAMDDIILILFSVIVLVEIGLLIYLIVLWIFPNDLLLTDQENLYIKTINNKEIPISIKEIETIKLHINIWAKPFLVYTSLSFEVGSKKYYLRHARNMDQVKEKVEHLMYLSQRQD